MVHLNAPFACQVLMFPFIQQLYAQIVLLALIAKLGLQFVMNAVVLDNTLIFYNIRWYI